jgi:hypothetical protein
MMSDMSAASCRSASLSISDEISRLEQLRSQGTLTDEEFVEAKQQVLDGVPGAVEIISDGRIFGIPENTWCLLMHLSQLTWFTAVGLILPIVMWVLSKDESDLARRHGARMMNWLISSVIYAAIGGALLWVIIGIPILLALILLNVVFPIMAAMKCNDGEVWSYPLALRIFAED